jgi:succinyl-CoA synthetase beta subunit
MRIHEYQAKEILKKQGIPVPEGLVIEKEEEAYNFLERFGFPIVVKAQVHSGGRGKAGLVKIVRSYGELESAIHLLLGKISHKLLLEECENVKKELYLALIIDRKVESPRIIVGREGGIEVEDVAKEKPYSIFSQIVDVRYGLLPYQIRRLFYFLDLDPALLGDFSLICERLYRIFINMECTLCEINPLAINDNGKFSALDAKMVFDDNALFRHRDILELYDPLQDDHREIEAKKYGLNYVKLSGDIGCIANGAGLAMATMDLVKEAGREPANFLDVGGGATKDMVKEGIRIVHSDPDVKAMFINIFGGILRCDTFALGFKESVHYLHKPIVMRLSGTNSEEGLSIIKELSAPLILVRNLKEAFEKLRELKY